MKKKYIIISVLTLLLTSCSQIGDKAPENMPESLKQSYLDVIESSESELAEGKTSIDIYLDLAFAYHQLHEYDLAVEHYEQVLEGDSSHYVALNNLMDLYESIEEYDLAAIYAQRFYENYPDDTNGLKKVIDVLIKADEPELALQALENFARNHGSDPEYSQLISNLYEKISDSN